MYNYSLEIYNFKISSTLLFPISSYRLLLVVLLLLLFITDPSHYNYNWKVRHTAVSYEEDTSSNLSILERHFSNAFPTIKLNFTYYCQLINGARTTYAWNQYYTQGHAVLLNISMSGIMSDQITAVLVYSTAAFSLVILPK